MAALDPDIVKIATMANQPHDNVRMLEMMQESEVPTVGMCMGDIGTPSRILAGEVRRAVHLRHVPPRAGAAPGQLSYQQMDESTATNSIKPETAVYGVIADPIGHSLSPHVHNAAFAAKRASTRCTCRSACRPTRWASSWRTCRGWASGA